MNLAGARGILAGMTQPSRKTSPARIVAFVALLITVIVCLGFAYVAVK